MVPHFLLECNRRESAVKAQIFFTHDATYLMPMATVARVKAIAWPPRSETMAKVVAKRIPGILMSGLLPGPWG